MKLLENLKHECVEAQAVLPNYCEGEPMLTWESVEGVNEKLDKVIGNVVRRWAHIAAGEFPDEWSVEDERAYREMFGKAIIILPEDDEGDI